jgi:mono/diheme cytochrome c family protein
MLKKILKLTTIVIGVLIIGFVITGWYQVSKVNKTIAKKYDVKPKMIHIPDDSASLAKGEKWTQILCAGCHGDNLAGFTMFEDPAIGQIDGSNLTPGKGGIGTSYTDMDWLRAIKHGVKPDGSAAIVMPSIDYSYMGDEDLGSLIAYLKTLPPIDNEVLNEPKLTTMAKIMASFGAFGTLFSAEEIDHNMGSAFVPVIGETVEYGTYLVNVFGCRTCHGLGMNGGKDPDPNAPFGPNITPGGNLGNWSTSEFIVSMRTGTTPEGRKMTKYMPWKGLSNMSDEELIAVYKYLQSLPKLESAVPENE